MKNECRPFRQCRKLRTKNLLLLVKQHRSVLDFTTAVEGFVENSCLLAFPKPHDLTFFQAVKIADSLGLSVKIDVIKKNEK